MLAYVLAVDLGGTQIRAALCDRSGRIHRRVACLTKAHEGPPAVLERMTGAIEAAMEGFAPAEIAAIGIGAPGPLDPVTGIVLEAPNLPGWSDVPLRSLISQRTGLPAFLGNDANLAALAEHTYGAGRGCQDMIYLTISTGIGSGIISGGRLLLGAHGLAAEAGHMIVEPRGPLCGCGNHGCLEAVAAGPAIARDVVSRIRSGKASRVSRMVGGDLARVDGRVVGEAAAAGDQLATNAFRRAGVYLGIGIVNLLRLFNPLLVILGGSVTKAGPLLLAPINQTVRAMAEKHYQAGLSIVEADLGDDVGLLGAAALAYSEIEEGRLPR